MYQNIFYVTADYFSAAFMLSKPEIVPIFNIFTLLKGLLVIIGLFVLALRSKKRKEALFFYFFAIAFLAPTLFSYRLAFQGNRMYVPMAGIIICTAYILKGFIENGIYSIKRKIVISSILLLFVFSNIIRTVNMMGFAYDDNSFFSAIINEHRLNYTPKSPTILYINNFFTHSAGHYKLHGHHKEAQNIKDILNKYKS